jgi:hypothetical protein
MIENQFQTKISVFRCGNETEYFNVAPRLFLNEKGIHHQSTCVNTPQTNGIAKKKNRHLLEITCVFTINPLA